MPVSRSGDNPWRRRTPGPRARRRAARAAQIPQIFAAHHGRYGRPKITAMLRQHGEVIAQKTVARLMAALGLRSGVWRRRPMKAATSSRWMPPIG
ncbi:MAG: IS3 family transposase [Firmicutes bacterium]|nr:IS3 family transposase [Bacillota bacterium]